MKLLSLIVGEKILPGDTLLIFDEIQECPAALNALKYFGEKAEEIFHRRLLEAYNNYLIIGGMPECVA